MKGKLLWSVFWALVVVFVISIVLMFPLLPVRVNPFIVWPIIFMLGVILLVLTVKTKVEGMPGKFLLVTGASAVGFLIFVLLHNIASGLFNIEEPVFFVLATIVCPIGFLVGVIGTIVLTIQKG